MFREEMGKAHHRFTVVHLCTLGPGIHACP